jgi:hypothetical protein
MGEEFSVHFLRAIARIEKEGLDPEAAVARFGSAF